MTDFQGALKELIVPAADKPMVRASSRPWLNGAEPKGANQIKKARARHKLVVALHMAGWRNNEIAKELGYTEGRVSIILSSRHKDLIDYRAEMADQVAQQTGDLILAFKAESRKSLNKLVEIRDDTAAPRSEQRQSALAILDRAGYSPVKKQINVDANIPFQELRAIVGQIDQANEVAVRRAEWQILDVPKPERMNG